MSGDSWRAQLQARLSADLKQLAEIDREIDRMRRLRERVAGKVEARTKDLADFEAFQGGVAENSSKTTRRPLKLPAIRAIAAAGDAGISEACLAKLLEAEPASLHTCLWRQQRSSPPLISVEDGTLRITEAGLQWLTEAAT